MNGKEVSKVRSPWSARLGWIGFFSILGLFGVAGEFFHYGERLAWWWIPVQLCAGAAATVVFLLVMAIAADDLRAASMSRRCDFSLLIVPVALAGFCALSAAFFLAPRGLSSGDRLNTYAMLCLMGAAICVPALIFNMIDRKRLQPSH